MTPKPYFCIFSSLYLPNMGGVETYTASLAGELARNGRRVLVVTCALHDDVGLSNENGIDVLRLPCMPLLDGRYPVLRRGKAFSQWWRWLKEQPISYIEIQTRFYPLSLMALAFAQQKGIVPVLLEHGSAHLTLGNAALDKAVEAVEHGMTRRCLKYPAAYYGVSQKASEWLRHFGITSNGELPNSIDADAYIENASNRNFRKELGINQDTLLVAFIGRLVPEKGVLLLAEASKLLAGNNIMIALGGDGPLQKDLKSYEGDTFRLLGKLKREDVAAFLMQADVMCLPSRSEGFATSLLEAAACQTPSIVTDVGGVDELIPNEDHGIVLDECTPASIASAILRMSNNREHAKSQGNNIGKRVRAKYGWQEAARKTMQACQQAQ